MMNFIDTHTHLYTEEFDEDRSEVISRAKEAGVSKCFLPAIDSEYTAAMLSTKKLFPENVYLMAGLHPCSVKENYKEELEKVAEFIAANEIVGIGETGLDYYWDKTFIKEQKESLHQHCRWALEYHKPLSLHTRESIDDAIALISEYEGTGIKGVFHCFTGTVRQAEEIIKMGFYLGIGGVLTFKNSVLYKVIKDIDPDFIVLETDSPYLAPAPHRGKRNESAYLRIIAEKLATLQNKSVESIAEITTRNALKIFSPG